MRTCSARRWLAVSSVMPFVMVVIACQPGPGQLSSRMGQGAAADTDQEIVRLYSGVYLATAALNSLKSLSVNYLGDNASISSIPRNYRALQQRHLAWLRSFTTQVEATAPLWSSIVDQATYEAAAEVVNQFAAAATGDADLAQASDRFAGDCMQVDGMLSDIEGQLARLRDQYFTPAAVAVGGPAVGSFRNDIVAAASAVDRYRSQLAAMRQQLRDLRERRDFLQAAVPDVWNRLLYQRLTVIDASHAQAIAGAVTMALRGDRVFAEIEAQARTNEDGIQAALDAFAPQHARRAYFAAQAALDRLDAQNGDEAIADAMRQAIAGSLADHRQSVASFGPEVTSALADAAAQAKERVRLTKLYMSHAAPGLSADCAALGNQVLALGETATNADAEDLYVSFKTACVNG